MTRVQDFKVLVSSIYYSVSSTMVYLPLVECETISDGTRETIFTFILIVRYYYILTCIRDETRLTHEARDS